MTVTIKVDSKLPVDVAETLEARAGEMFAKQTGRWVAVVELAHVERTEPAPGEDKDPTVKLRIVDIELANNDRNDERLREAMLELYDRRTNSGTLAEVGMATSVSSLLQHGAGVLA